MRQAARGEGGGSPTTPRLKEIEVSQSGKQQAAILLGQCAVLQVGEGSG